MRRQGSADSAPVDGIPEGKLLAVLAETGDGVADSLVERFQVSLHGRARIDAGHELQLALLPVPVVIQGRDRVVRVVIVILCTGNVKTCQICQVTCVSATVPLAAVQS